MLARRRKASDIRGGCRGHPLIPAIGKDAFDEREQPTRLLQQGQDPVTILHIGRVDLGCQDQAEGVDHDVALLAVDPLARIEARRVDVGPTFSAAFTLWLSRMAALGLASRPASSRAYTNSACCRRARVPLHSHSFRYSCTVLRGGRSFGNARHWQPVDRT